MSSEHPDDLVGRVFICYAREDRERVDRLQDALEGAGIRTWRDTTDIWPGQDWKLEIRRAIASGTLAFLACFSENSEQAATSYQNEELAVAVEQMRLRRPGVSWLIPLRFADCAIPDFDLGAGRMLDSLQRVDLPDDSWERGIPRLIGAVHRALGGSPGARGDKDERPSTASPVAVVTPGPTAARQGANTLPADTVSFTGREDQLAEISMAAAAAAQAGRMVAIYAIDGMPGVGKTTLAVHVGHKIAARFPDRQLFMDLHAHTPGQRPVDPGDALATLLAADGVDPRSMPADLDSRAAMWRARMAAKRVLLILDNAASTEQVAPLLPGAAECLVLVTSRRYLGDLPSGLGSLQLGTLPSDDACAMFVALASRAGTEPDLVAEMTGLCGHLPLAITLLARLFVRHRSWDMTDLITQTQAKLLTVGAENRTVAAAFQLSYQYLTARHQRFFVHLGLHPGPDIDPYAAAAVAGVPYDETIQILDELHADGLLAEPAPRRYRMHNLIHLYARSLAAEDDFADER